MVNLSLREAAKHFNVSRPTLQKALKSGKLSGVQDGKGIWTIDPSELARIYQPRAKDLATMANKEQVNIATKNTHEHDEVAALKAKLAEAEQRAAVAEALAKEREQHIEDLRRMLPAPSAKSRWWPWSKR